MADAKGKPVDGDTPYPTPLPVRQVLTEDLDLSAREPFAELVGTLHRAATDPAEQTTLAGWSEALAGGDQSAAAAMSKTIADTYVNLADLLEAFPSAKLDLAQLIELLPRQKPRLYSISSSSLVYPEQVHLMIGVLAVKTPAGKTRPGVCSNYLASLDPAAGATARIAVRTSHFRPPDRLDSPVLMVGPGTGLSPLIGFMQDRGHRIEQARKAASPPGRARPACTSAAATRTTTFTKRNWRAGTAAAT